MWFRWRWDGNAEDGGRAGAQGECVLGWDATKIRVRRHSNVSSSASSSVPPSPHDDLATVAWAKVREVLP